MTPALDHVFDEVRGAWRFRWVGLIAAVIIALMGWLVVFALPDRYEAEARVFVDTRTALLQGMNDPPKLEPNKVTIALKFVVTRTGGATGQIKFLVFTLGGGATLTSENSNTITLTFGKAGP